jgi:uncharacterized protein YbjT (DUF2867 family)
MRSELRAWHREIDDAVASAGTTWTILRPCSFFQNFIMYIPIEEDQARAMMLQKGIPPWLVEAGLAVFAHARSGGEAAVDPALTRILQRPATSLSEFVERNQRAWL